METMNGKKQKNDGLCRDAQKKLETEVKHQEEEAERSALTKQMLSDYDAKSPNLNRSCFNVLNNFQGKVYITIYNL